MSVFIRRTLGATVLALLTQSAQGQAVTVVQPFAGSETIAEYTAEFDQVTILADDAAENFSSRSIEGAVVARVLTAPEGKSVLEVARSFEQTLLAEGFEILFSRRITRTKATPATGSRNWIRDLEKVNGARDFERAEGATGLTTSLQRVYTFPAYYLAARRVGATEEIHFALTMEDTRRHYLIEQVSQAVMADDTVTLSEEGLATGIEAEGKAVLYGVQFDIGSAVLRPSSRDSIEAIAAVLKARAGRFYIVGHTSDTGSFEENIRLSKERAASIITILGTDYGIDTSRLQPIGVGPAAPLASNKNDAGRQLNRRVELVERLD